MVKDMEEDLMGLFFTTQELNIIYKQDIQTAIFFVEIINFSVFNRVDVFIDEIHTLDVHDGEIFMK